jgi:hypothetical protein
MRAKDDLAGRKVRCPQCGAAVRIPTPATATAAAPVVTAKARARELNRGASVPRSRPAARPVEAVSDAPLVAPRMPAPPPVAATPVVPTIVTRAMPPASTMSPATIYGVPVSRRGASAQDARRGAGLFHISGLSLTLIIAIVVIPTSIYLIKAGPVTANREWDRAYNIGIEDSQSVIARALHAHITNETGRPIVKSRDMPGVQNFRWVDEPQIMWRMPDWVEFRGRCSGGEYAGRYYTRTGEVQAVIDYSGTPLNVTGRVKGSSVECEIGGKPAVPLAAKPSDLIEDEPF